MVRIYNWFFLLSVIKLAWLKNMSKIVLAGDDIEKINDWYSIPINLRSHMFYISNGSLIGLPVVILSQRMFGMVWAHFTNMDYL